MRRPSTVIRWPDRGSCAGVLGAVLLAGVAGCTGDRIRTSEASDAAVVSASAEAAAAAGPVRFHGTVEAVRSRSVIVPRMRGTVTPLVITYLVKAGTRVEPGDLLVEFDRQEQARIALDRRAEVVDLDGQIAKKAAEQSAAESKDLTELKQAEHDLERAKLNVRTNALIARVEAEKNTLAHDQASARLEQLRLTFQLKREAAAADLRILEIRRERAERALDYAERNAELMQIRAPFAGLAVIKTTFRGQSGLVQYIEGDEVRPGAPVVDIVDTSAMQVRARVNQADGELVRADQAATIRLDGFPDLEFAGKVISVTPLATQSQFSPTVRSFTAVVSIDAVHEQLLPDLTASVEVAPDPSVPASAGGRP